MPHGPLHGIKVLDFSIIYAGPYAGFHLADMGADVVKVEREWCGPERQAGPIVGMSKSPPPVAAPAPTLGRHTDGLLREAGYEDGEVAHLRKLGVIA